MADATEREERKARNRMSNWVAAAEGGSREYLPTSSNPLDFAYQRSKNQTRSAQMSRLDHNPSSSPALPPAAKYISAKYSPDKKKPFRTDSLGASVVLGSDLQPVRETSNSAYGIVSEIPREEIDMLQTVRTLRDTTLDGAHRASMQETHFLSIWDPYISQQRLRSASFQSAGQLREAYHKHVRSQYHPDEKYVLPPTVQNEIGWGLNLERYRDSCAKYQDGAVWHGRSATATAFAERLLTGARHHASGPMTNPKLHY